MNKEQQQIIDGVYMNYSKKHFKEWEPGMNYESKESFINKCKTDPEFSNKWGLQIEERELSLEERVKLYGVEKINTTDAGYYEHSYAQSEVDEANTPTKLITITYNNETIESYE